MFILLRRVPACQSLFPNGKIPFSWVSLAGIPSLGFPPLLGTYVLPPLRPAGLFCPERTPSWKWFWKEFPSDRISFSSDSGLSELGSFSGEGMCCRFWFSVSRDLLRLLEDGRDWGLLEEPGHSFLP